MKQLILGLVLGSLLTGAGTALALYGDDDRSSQEVYRDYLNEATRLGPDGKQFMKDFYFDGSGQRNPC